MKVSCHDEFVSGTFKQASAEALMMKSFTETFTPSDSVEVFFDTVF